MCVSVTWCTEICAALQHRNIATGRQHTHTQLNAHVRWRHTHLGRFAKTFSLHKQSSENMDDSLLCKQLIHFSIQLNSRCGSLDQKLRFLFAEWNVFPYRGYWLTITWREMRCERLPAIWSRTQVRSFCWHCAMGCQRLQVRVRVNPKAAVRHIYSHANTNLHDHRELAKCFWVLVWSIVSFHPQTTNTIIVKRLAMPV